MTKITAKEALEKIKKMLFTEGSQAASSAASNDATSVSYNLKDGTAIKVIGDLAQGSEVLVNTADGDQPAPDGELELSDGTLISIVGGLITEIETPNQEIDEKNGGANPDETRFAVAQKLESKITELEKELASFKQTFNRHLSAQKALIELVGQLAALPADEPVIKPKNAFLEVKSRQDAKMKSLVDSLQKMRKDHQS